MKETTPHPHPQVMTRITVNKITVNYRITKQRTQRTNGMGWDGMEKGKIILFLKQVARQQGQHF